MEKIQLKHLELVTRAWNYNPAGYAQAFQVNNAYDFLKKLSDESLSFFVSENGIIRLVDLAQGIGRIATIKFFFSFNNPDGLIEDTKKFVFEDLKATEMLYTQLEPINHIVYLDDYVRDKAVREAQEKVTLRTEEILPSGISETQSEISVQNAFEKALDENLGKQKTLTKKQKKKKVLKEENKELVTT